MKKISAKVIADSISEVGKRPRTLELCYPRFIHSEVMTHRVFSRNASSSRAIPVAKMIEQVRNDPAMPIHWGKNQPGMQAKEELNAPVNVWEFIEEDGPVDGYYREGQVAMSAQEAWRRAAAHAADIAKAMSDAGYHKQVVNRLLEPFQWMHVVLTATEFDNFFELRAHEDAQPEIHELAIQMRAAMEASSPQLLRPGEWHLPYVTEEELSDILWRASSAEAGWDLARKISAARCCRVSYLKHDGHPSTIEEDLALCDRLAGARPIHASPFEHQATPDVLVPGSRGQMARWRSPELHGNFVGWIQSRKLIELSFNE